MSNATEDLVPLAERRRWLRLFRITAAILVALTGVVLPEYLRTTPSGFAAGIAAYLALACAAEVAWSLSRRRGLPLFGLLLILDGAFLGWAAHMAAEPASPLRFLIVGHIVAVTLLASFRSGMKVTLWHSLVLLTVFHAREAGVLGEPVALGDLEYRTMLVSLSMYWAMAVATAAFAAINERELRRRRYDLEALAGFARRLEMAAGAREVAEHLVEAVADTFGFERILLFASPTEPLVLLHAHGVEQAADGAAVSGSDLLARAGGSAEPLLISTIAPQSDPWLTAFLPGSRNLVLVPLHAEGRTIGVLVCEHGMRSGSRIERRVVAMLERFASQSSLALDNAWLLEQLQRSAATDGLTGLANRRHFDLAFGQKWAQSARAERPLSVVLADVDHFKRLNDTHGHQVGDDVLRRVAETLGSAARAGDLVARYGGEEFVIVLEDADPVVARKAAERLRVAVSDCAAGMPVTISLGVATYPQDALDPEELVRRADGALYAAKARGRNRVTTAAGVQGLDASAE